MFRQRVLSSLCTALRQNAARSSAVCSSLAPAAVLGYQSVGFRVRADAPRAYDGRSFASSAANVADAELKNVLSSEIANEQEEYEALKLTPPSPFKIKKDAEGVSETVLIREFGKDETVTVSFLAEGQDEEMSPTGEEDEDEEDTTGHLFTVQVSRPGMPKNLTFTCITNGGDIEVRLVYLVAPGTDAEEDLDYHGPTFEELDEKLQTGLNAYLEARGIDADLASFMFQYAEDKEQRLYMSWLDGMDKFIS